MLKGLLGSAGKGATIDEQCLPKARERVSGW